ncbi:MAG: acyltransferase [Rhodobiaceae bacterium]|nr:acyltransferase [Rhodobiaceae bacterium]
MKTIGQAWASGSNNFDILRLAAAIAVIVSHAFYLQSGLNSDEPLATSTGLPLGWHAVQVFFIISGFLIFASFERRRGLGAFVLARVLRIMPAFIAAALFVVLAVGPMVTELPLSEYFRPAGIFAFLGDTLIFFDTDMVLPGAFTNLPTHVPLGTIWTLKYEIFSYAGLAFAGWLGLTRHGLFYVLSAIGLVALGFIVHANPEILERFGALQHLLRLGGCFLLGMIAWHWRERIPLHFGGVAALAILAILLRDTAVYRPALYVAEAYGVMWFAFSAFGTRMPRLSFDYSYGIYLIGFPVQQVVRLWFADNSAIAQLAIALPVAILLAAISWHFLEKPFMSLKDYRWRAGRALVAAE